MPDLPSVPVAPVILVPQEPFALFEHFKGYDWVLPLVRYKDVADLLRKLPKSVIERAEKKASRRTGNRGKTVRKG